MSVLGDRIKQAREAMAPRMTQEALGKIIGVTRAAVAQWEAGENAPTADKIEPLAKALRRTAAWLLGDDDTAGKPPGLSDVTPTDLPAHLAAAGAWPKDVPVLGTTVGGREGDFTLNVGQVVDYARRPPTLARPRNVFALYVQGSSMAPWRVPGSFVYLDPVRPPRIGDHVVVECHPDREGEGHPAYLKEFAGQAGHKIKLKQYNPEKAIELAAGNVKRIYRVIEWEEVLGL